MAILVRPAVAADAPLLERTLLAAATWRGDSHLTAASLGFVDVGPVQNSPTMPLRFLTQGLP